MKKTRTWETLFFYMGIIGGIAAAGAAAIVRLTSVRMAGWGFPCFLNTYFHIPCPGCGGTRAIEYLLQGRLWDSFLAHPLIVYAAGCYLYKERDVFSRKAAFWQRASFGRRHSGGGPVGRKTVVWVELGNPGQEILSNFALTEVLSCGIM